MITLNEARKRIGDGVVYRPYPGSPAEDGDVTRVSDRFVFVQYRGDRHAKATRPEDLSWLMGFRGELDERAGGGDDAED